MNNRAWLFGVALMALAVGGCAGKGGTHPAMVQRDCFTGSSVRGFTPIDDETVRLQVGGKAVYEARLMTYCPDIDWTQAIALRTVAGSSLICTRDPMALELVMLDRTSPGPDRCRVQSLRKVPAEELAAEKAAREAARAARKPSH